MPKSIKKLKALEIDFWEGFWRIWGGKMEPSWFQDEIQNGTCLENAENKKYKKKLIKPMNVNDF